MVNSILEEIISEITIKLGYGKISAKKSKNLELCDYQIDDVFRLSKANKKSPMLIGNEIVSEINKHNDFIKYFKKVEFLMPGFINITLSDEFINSQLKKMNDNLKFNIKMPNKKEIYFIDYGGPNIAKPLHVGHMRTAIVGESIKRIIKYLGHDVIADVHLGDYGLQIGQVIYKIIEDKKNIDEITLEYLEEIYPKISELCKENIEIKDKCALITKELQENNEYYNKLFKIILEVSGNDIKRLYKYLDVSFDLWEGESDSYKYILETEKFLESKNLIKDSLGAKIIEVKEESDLKEMPPLIFQKSNKAYLYGTTDLATIYDRESKFHPDYILYVVDNRQSLHFEQVFRVAKKSELTKSKLEFLGYGTVNGIDGKPFKTRSGDAPKLDELFKQTEEIFTSKKEDNKIMSQNDIDKIVNSILKFADLQNSRDRDYIFDINKFSNVVGKTGPYMLYTCLRLNKIIESVKTGDKLSNIIYNDVDRNLRIKILDLEEQVNKAFNERMPSYIVDYIYNLAVQANNFYQNNHIGNCQDENRKNDWLYLINLTNKILREMLKLVIIDIPTIM